MTTVISHTFIFAFVNIANDDEVTITFPLTAADVALTTPIDYLMHEPHLQVRLHVNPRAMNEDFIAHWARWSYSHCPSPFAHLVHCSITHVPHQVRSTVTLRRKWRCCY